jgi:hypothetical protein
VQIFATAERVRDATGAMAFGTDASKWDSWFYDAANIIRIEQIKENNARIDAERRSG